MNQFDGSVSHIDPMTNRVVDTIAVEESGISGGDRTIGEGRCGYGRRSRWWR